MSQPRRETLLIVLAFNEAGSISDTVRELRQLQPGATVAVIDDGSSDATATKAREAGAVVIVHPINLGVAAAEATGLRYAVKHGFKRAVRLDGDGQHDPASLQAFIAALDAGEELVVGSRFKGEASYSSSGLRFLASRFLAALLSLLSGVKVTDPTSGYRGFTGRALAHFAEHHPDDYPEPESVLRAARLGFRVTEIPARMRPRRAGKSSLTAVKSLVYMAKVSFALCLEALRPRSQP